MNKIWHLILVEILVFIIFLIFMTAPTIFGALNFISEEGNVTKVAYDEYQRLLLRMPAEMTSHFMFLVSYTNDENAYTYSPDASGIIKIEFTYPFLAKLHTPAMIRSVIAHEMGHAISDYIAWSKNRIYEEYRADLIGFALSVIATGNLCYPHSMASFSTLDGNFIMNSPDKSHPDWPQRDFYLTPSKCEVEWHE